MIWSEITIWHSESTRLNEDDQMVSGKIVWFIQIIHGIQWSFDVFTGSFFSN